MLKDIYNYKFLKLYNHTNIYYVHLNYSILIFFLLLYENKESFPDNIIL